MPIASSPRTERRTGTHPCDHPLRSAGGAHPRDRRALALSGKANPLQVLQLASHLGLIVGTCATLTTASAGDLVVEATEALYRDASAVDRYFSSNYKEHGQYAADGPDGLRAFAESLPEDFRYERVHLLAEKDLVVTHGVYHGFDPGPQVAFDVWRVADGKIVEHWDAIGPLAGETPTASPAEETRSADTAAESKAIVSDFVQGALVRGDHCFTASVVAAGGFLHHPLVDELATSKVGDSGWLRNGKPLIYAQVHQVVAEGDLVFTRSEALQDGPASVNDLWRVADGMIVEHWEVIEPINDELPHDNGVF